jgi:hypothetical protein
MQTAVPCDGDCDNSGAVELDELVRGVRIALGLAAMTDGLRLDDAGDGDLAIDELVLAVRHALSGCKQ